MSKLALTCINSSGMDRAFAEDGESENVSEQFVTVKRDVPIRHTLLRPDGEISIPGATVFPRTRGAFPGGAEMWPVPGSPGARNLCQPQPIKVSAFSKHPHSGE